VVRSFEVSGSCPLRKFFSPLLIASSGRKPRPTASCGRRLHPTSSSGRKPQAPTSSHRRLFTTAQPSPPQKRAGCVGTPLLKRRTTFQGKAKIGAPESAVLSFVLIPSTSASFSVRTAPNNISLLLLAAVARLGDDKAVPKNIMQVRFRWAGTRSSNKSFFTIHPHSRKETSKRHIACVHAGKWLCGMCSVSCQSQLSAAHYPLPTVFPLFAQPGDED
jgi:hypothetical protein